MGKLKKAIYENLSYTSQDYNTILAEIIEMFSKEGGIETRFNNMSESDIMFIVMSLMSAHKDILNYMLDYRILETYMSTAKERASMTRIANSFGYKIPSYKASFAQVKLDETLSGVSGELESFTTFIAEDESSWVYIGPAFTIDHDTVINVYQGLASSLNFNMGDVDNIKKTHIISNESIAIGNNANNKGVSRLLIDGILWEEIPNIYSYRGLNERVYELNVDPQGITYVKFLRNINLNDYTNATIDFIITRGSNITNITPSCTATIIINGNPEELEFEEIPGSFVKGSNPATSSQIREGFNRFYASANSLVTLEDYKNFILFEQKEVLGLYKCLVADKQRDTLGGEGDSTLEKSKVLVYVTLEDSGNYNEPPSKTERDSLLLELEKYKMTGLELFVNGFAYNATSAEAQAFELVDITIKITEPTGGFPNGFVDFVEEYINKKGIGENLTSSELYSLVLNSRYAPYFSADGLQIEMVVDGTSYYTSVVVDYYQALNCTSVDALT